MLFMGMELGMPLPPALILFILHRALHLTGDLSQELFNSGCCNHGGQGDAWAHNTAACWDSTWGEKEEARRGDVKSLTMKPITEYNQQTV